MPRAHCLPQSIFIQVLDSTTINFITTEDFLENIAHIDIHSQEDQPLKTVAQNG